MTPQELSVLLNRISAYQWESLKWLISSRERYVLRLMCRRPKPTLAKAARELKVTPERIRQIYHKALRGLCWRVKKLKALGEYDFILNPKQELTEQIPTCPVDLDLTVDYLELPSRIHNCFVYAGIKTLREITSRTENELMAIKCFGYTSLGVLENRLSDLGLKLREMK